jgi:hypothetical protein
MSKWIFSIFLHILCKYLWKIYLSYIHTYLNTYLVNGAMLAKTFLSPNLSSFQCGLILASSLAIRLCSRIQSVCVDVSPGTSLALGSNARWVCEQSAQNVTPNSFYAWDCVKNRPKCNPQLFLCMRLCKKSPKMSPPTPFLSKLIHMYVHNCYLGTKLQKILGYVLL